MPPEDSECKIGAWLNCPVRVGVEQRLEDFWRALEEREKLVAIRDQNYQRALEVARNDMERRLEGMNALRAQLDNQAKTFVTHIEFELVRTAVEKLDKRQSTLLAYVFGAAAMASIAVGFFDRFWQR